MSAPVLILGGYRAASDYARSRGLRPGEWSCAYDKESAIRALQGADPNIEIVTVAGDHRAWSPEFEARLRLLEALRPSRGETTGPSDR